MYEEIKEKAEKCLNCTMKPCSKNGCPLNNNIPEFIQYIKNEKYDEAYKTLNNSTVLESICGRICPHKKQCQGSCVRGIKGEAVNIGDLEAFIGDYAIEHELNIELEEEPNLLSTKKVAIVGGGPSGLTAAAFLAKKGVNVTIYEKYDYLGGLLIHGIPEFRLSKKIVEKTIQKIIELGIEVKYKQELGKNLDLNYLTSNYDYIYLAIGANISSKMGIKGENLLGVYGGNELLEHKKHPDYKNKTIIVNGGGNVAMDVARTVKKMGAKNVIVVYRRAREQMPAEQKEIQDAINEGIQFMFQNNIIEIKGTNKVEKVELIKTQLVKKEGETRLSPVNIEGSNYEIDVDYVVMALGSKTSEIVKTLGIELTQKNYIKIDENYQTSNPKILAGGDLVGSKGTVAYAARDRKKCC